MADPTPTPVCGSWRGPDRVLVRAVADASGGELTMEQARDAVERTFTAMAVLLRDGKYVTITDVGKLSTRLKRKTDWSNGKRRIRADRVAALTGTSEIDGREVVLDGQPTHRGEPYEPLS